MYWKETTYFMQQTAENRIKIPINEKVMPIFISNSLKFEKSILFIISQNFGVIFAMLRINLHKSLDLLIFLLIRTRKTGKMILNF